MMIFKKVNATNENAARAITINNMEVSNYHWGSEKILRTFLEEFEILLPLNTDEKNKDFIMKNVEATNELIRITDVKFYKDTQNPKNIYMLSLTDISNIGDLAPFERFASVFLKRSDAKFSIYELTNDHTKKLAAGELKVPENWQLDEALTKKFLKYKNAFSVF